MNNLCVIDTSALIAVIANETHKATLVSATMGLALVAPGSVAWEIGNAFSAMFKRARLDMNQARLALRVYRSIPIRWVEVDIEHALFIAYQHKIYAYDAYLLQAALEQRAPLLTLDEKLKPVAKACGVQLLHTEKTP